MKSSTQSTPEPLSNIKLASLSRNIDKKRMTLNGDVNGKYVVNFRPTDGGSSLDLEGQFWHACYWAPKQWENHWELI